METLEERRKKIDLTETYKFLTNKYKTDPKSLFSIPNVKLRGHSKKLFKPRKSTLLAQNFFSSRVIDSWNSLPEKLVSAQSVESFKKIQSSLSTDKE